MCIRDRSVTGAPPCAVGGACSHTSCSARVQNVDPVSYTHLDVYKRQHVRRGHQPIGGSTAPFRVHPPEPHPVLHIIALGPGFSGAMSPLDQVAHPLGPRYRSGTSSRALSQQLGHDESGEVARTRLRRREIDPLMPDLDVAASSASKCSSGVQGEDRHLVTEQVPDDLLHE